MRSLPPGSPGTIDMRDGMTTAQQLAAMKKQAAALGRQVAQAQAAQAAAEALLRSHGLAVPDG